MSWFLAARGAHLSAEQVDALRALHPAPTISVHTPELYVAGGGLPETFIGQGNEHGGFVVAGLGMEVQLAGATFLDAADWRQCLADDSFDAAHDLDGHFALLTWTAEHVRATTDALGLRAVYYATTPFGSVVSTRLDSLARLLPSAELDADAIGSTWLTYSALWPRSPVRGVHRLLPGAVLTLRGDAPDIRKRPPWRPNASPSGATFDDTLHALVRPQNSARPVSLGLSGGLDSRLLLALRDPSAQPATHTFGPIDHPDAQLAGRIARDLALSHRHLETALPSAEQSWALVVDHMRHAPLAVPASAALALRHFPALRAAGFFAMDGAFGEIARRRFLNRLAARPRLLSGTPSAALLPHIGLHRPDVFHPDLQPVFTTGTLDDLDRVWSSLPRVEDVGAGTFLDLLAVRTKLANAFAHEQARLDQSLRLYMPFAQPSFLNAVFALPVRARRGGRLFRRLIRSHAPGLTRFPLVKGPYTYPYPLRTIPAAVWMRVAERLGKRHVSRERSTALEHLRPVALERVERPALWATSWYRPGLREDVAAFYRGDASKAVLVDGWLAVQALREALFDQPR